MDATIQVAHTLVTCTRFLTLLASTVVAARAGSAA